MSRVQTGKLSWSLLRAGKAQVGDPGQHLSEQHGRGDPGTECVQGQEGRSGTPWGQGLVGL